MQRAIHANRWAGRLLVIALVSTGLLFTVAVCRRIWGADFWWQYATGQLVAERGIPEGDAFSYTFAGAEWIEMRWLYCYVLYHLVEAVGFVGPIIVKWLMLASAFLLVVFSAGRPRLGIVAPVMLLATVATVQRFFVRPELVSLLFFALFVWIIRRHLETRTRLVFLLPVLQIVWTNAHTLFILGPLLVGLYATTSLIDVVRGRAGTTEPEEAVRRFRLTVLIFLLTAAACLVNPYGLSGTLFPFTLYAEMRDSAFKASIAELQSPFHFHPLAPILCYEALIGLSAVSAALNYRRLDWFWTILVGSQFYLSVTAVRNVPLFVLAAVPFILFNLGRSGALDWRLPGRGRPLVAMGLAVAVAGGSLYFAYRFYSNREYVEAGDTNETGLGLARNRFPEHAVRFLDEKGMRGKLFHTFLEGSYLAARGFRVFIDPRLEVYGEDHFRHYLRIVTKRGAFREAAATHGFEVALIDMGALLVQWFPDHADWSLRYFDETVAVFARRHLYPEAPELVTADDFARAVDALRRHLPSPRPAGLVVHSPQPFIRVASFLLGRGLADLAWPFLEDARKAFKLTPDLERGFAIARYLKTQHDGGRVPDDPARRDPRR